MKSLDDLKRRFHYHVNLLRRYRMSERKNDTSIIYQYLPLSKNEDRVRNMSCLSFVKNENILKRVGVGGPGTMYIHTFQSDMRLS